ncbi:GNAT family protein [Micromonospora sp. M12]
MAQFAALRTHLPGERDAPARPRRTAVRACYRRSRRTEWRPGVRPAVDRGGRAASAGPVVGRGVPRQPRPGAEHIQPWVSPTFVATDLASARAVLQRYAERWASDSGGIWGCGGAARSSAGHARVVRRDPGRLRGRLLGGALSAGQGMVAPAVRRIIDWAVRERGIQRVEWRTNADNTRSKALARRLGLRLDGTLRQVSPGPHGRIDLEIWSVLADEWQTGRAIPGPPSTDDAFLSYPGDTMHPWPSPRSPSFRPAAFGAAA